MVRSLPALLFAILLSGGCAVKSTVKLVQATQAVDRAGERGAAEDAAYEYTLATLYLDKAREEAGDAHHRLAQRLADVAADHADQAVIRMQEGGSSPKIPGEPATDQPAAGEAATEQPADAQQPATGGSDKPASDEPDTDEPDTDEPIEGGWTPPAEAPPEDAP